MSLRSSAEFRKTTDRPTYHYIYIREPKFARVFAIHKYKLWYKYIGLYKGIYIYIYIYINNWFYIYIYNFCLIQLILPKALVTKSPLYDRSHAHYYKSPRVYTRRSIYWPIEYTNLSRYVCIYNYMYITSIEIYNINTLAYLHIYILYVRVCAYICMYVKV